jgi:sugar lactone lactonase YvrE
MIHRLGAALVLLLGPGLLLAPAAAGPRGVPFEAGNALAGQISVGEAEDTFVFDALEGSLFDASAAGDKVSGLFPRLALFDPAGGEMDLTGRKSEKGAKAAVKKVLLPATGRYALVVSASPGTSGGYVIKTKVKTPKPAAIASVPLAPYARRDLPIPGAGGATVSLDLYVLNGVTPEVPDVLDPDGTSMAGDWAAGLTFSPSGIEGKFPLAGPLGIYGLRLVNDSDQTLQYAVNFKVKMPKPGKATVTATDPEPRVDSLSKSTAFSGDTVVVYGSGFADGCGVWFGDVASPAVSFVDSGEVTAEVPDCQGLLPVGVRNPDGQENPRPDAITVSGPASLEVLFPPADGLTDAESIHVSGTSRFVAALGVNGVPADFDADGRTWEAVVPLAAGANGLSLAGTGLDGGPFASIGPVVTVTRTGAVPVSLDGIAADFSGGRLFVPDAIGHQILAVGLADGWRTLVSSVLRGTGVADLAPTCLAWDGAGERVLCTDRAYGLVSVDPGTGDRTILSSNTVGSGPQWSNPMAVVANTAGTLAFVGTQSGGAIYSVDLATGARTVVSGGAVGSGPEIGDPAGLVLDAAGTRLFVADGGQNSVFSVDLTTGDRTLFSNYLTGTGPNWSRPQGLALDEANSRLFVAAQGSDALFSADLATGNRTLVSKEGTGTGTLFQSLTGVVFDPGTGTAYLPDYELDVVFAVAVANGNRSIHSEGFRGAGTHFITPTALALKPAGDVLFVGDTSNWSVRTVAADTGDRALLADDTHGTGGGFEPSSLYFDATGDRLLLGSSYEILVLDVLTGSRTGLSGSGVGTGPELMYTNGLCADSLPGRILATTAHQNGVFSVDLATGDRSVVADGSVGTGPALYSPQGIVHDPERDRFLVVENNNSMVLALDRGTGDRFTLAGWGAGSGPEIRYPAGICLTGGGAVLANGGHSNLLLVDPVTGDRTILSGPGVGRGPPLATPEVVLPWPGDHAVVLTDLRLRAVVVVHLRSGDRLILSK